MSIPHTWYTIAENLNDTLYTVTTIMDNGVTPTWYHALALEMPSGNYTGTSLALALQAELNIAAPDHQFVCIYKNATGSITIRSDYILLLSILSDYQIITSTTPQVIIWKHRIGNVYVDLYSLKSLNEVIRNSNNSEYHPLTIAGAREFETGFIDLHCS